MSMSVAGCSQAQSYQQQMQQVQAQGGNDSTKATASPDMLTELMQAAADAGPVPAPNGGPLAQLSDTSSTGTSAFSTDTMHTLLSLQDQSASGTATSADHTDQPITTVPPPPDTLAADGSVGSLMTSMPQLG